MVQHMKLGIQLYSVRDAMEKDFEGTLRAVKAMGYDGVEFAGLFGKSGEEVRAILDNIGLVGISAHVSLDEILKDIPGTAATYKAIGCQFVAVPWLGEDRRPGHERYEETLEDIRRVGEEFHKAGIQLLYHNHDFEFVKVDGEYALDRMYSAIPASVLQTELDTCWVNVAGEDPVAYLHKYAGRAPVVHLKDFVMPGKKPAHLYELIGVDEEASADETEQFEFRPNGYGVQNIPAILAASEKAGAGWVIVEQDSPSMGKSSMECAKMSADYLASLETK